VRQVGGDQIARDPFLLVQQIDRDHPDAADEPLRRADPHHEVEEAHPAHEFAIALCRPQADARLAIQTVQPLDVALSAFWREGVHAGVGARPDVNQPFQARIGDREGANGARLSAGGAHARFLILHPRHGVIAWERIPERAECGIAPKDSSAGSVGESVHPHYPRRTAVHHETYG